eukprot:TRINITY_DN23175_c0_g2_i1.p1 TRINITY_DN23175_c0_g2~~TRINITY_DN23175_c0_g2_i1.p1  ORF type:complete len:174 (-),score=14.45 TRINITY_DN23175_c0_g2_i1:90-560(-)
MVCSLFGFAPQSRLSCFTTGPSHLTCSQSRRSYFRVCRRAGNDEPTSRRRFVFFEAIFTPSPGAAAFWAIFSLVGWFLTREERARKVKICPRSKQFVEDYMADPKKTAFLASKGVPYESMRTYLQGPDCVELNEFIEIAKTAKPFWEVGEEYSVTG